jgi:hypothetical protein
MILVFTLRISVATFLKWGRRQQYVPCICTHEIGGRLMTDTAWYNNNANVAIADGTEICRARLFAEGSFGNWHFKGQYDFAGNQAMMFQQIKGSQKVSGAFFLSWP